MSDQLQERLRAAQAYEVGKEAGAREFARWLQVERGLIGEDVDVETMLDQWQHFEHERLTDRGGLLS